MVSKANEYRDFISSLRSGLGYWKSYSLAQFTLSMTRLMRSEKISGKKLAALLRMSPTQVSKVLRGSENVTIETMAKFADALDAVVYIHVAKRGVQVQWVETQPDKDRFASNYPATVVDFAARAARAQRARLQVQNLSVTAHVEEAYG